MAKTPSSVSVRIELSKSSRTFCDALSELMGAIAHADRALLDDAIAEAHAKVVSALTDPDALGFALDDA